MNGIFQIYLRPSQIDARDLTTPVALPCCCLNQPKLWSTIIQRWSYAGQTCSLAYHVHAGPWPSRDWQFKCSSKYLGIVRVSASIRQCIVDFTHPLAKCLIPQIPSFTWLWTYALVKGFLLSINLKFVPTRSPSASIASKRSQPFQILAW